MLSTTAEDIKSPARDGETHPGHGVPYNGTFHVALPELDGGLQSGTGIRQTRQGNLRLTSSIDLGLNLTNYFLRKVLPQKYWKSEEIG